MNQKLYAFLGLFLCFSFAGYSQITITDADITDGTYTWTSDNVYLIDGFVFLEPGGVLNIEPGTVIKATPNPELDNASALIITRGAQINANGTRTNPIIFTAEADDVTDPDDMTLEGGEGVTDRGSWGGLIILGNGIVGAEGGTGEAAIEGIPAGDDRALYGGNDNGDSSGSLSYVSIRYGGAALSSGNEINGLTLGGVGSGTSIEFVEVYGNADDGIEIFGGAVDLKYVIGAFCGDESFDTDQAWAGRTQFLFGIQLDQDGLGNQQFGGEHDGSEAEDLAPQVVHKIYNATMIGAGPNNSNSNGETNTGLRIRNDVGIEYNNSIITEYANKGARFQDTAEEKYRNDEFQFENNIWWNFGDGNTPQDFIRADVDQAAVIAKILAEGNEVSDPQLAGISRTADGGLDPRPNGGSPALSGAADVDDEWFTQTNYRGAFSNTSNWAEGWTALSVNGHFGDLATRSQVLITDADLVGDTEYNWTADNEYLIDGFVFLESGSCLNIEPGTVIRATPNPTLDNASALIISRGAQIKAEGTRENPIIFTSQADDLSSADDLSLEGGEGVTDRGSWGGLIILGNGIIGAEGGTGEAAIEGIPAGDDRALYGGTTADDNSGILRYVSIRYGGAALSSGNEINGLTLGGVGSGTSIEFVEVYGNADDGIEIFGGAVDLRYIIGAFCGDESFDTDQAWAGRAQFVFGIQLPNDGLGNQQFGGEHDGSEAEDLSPQVVHKVYNATFIGAGADNSFSNGETNTGLRIRNDVGIEYNNSIITEFATRGVRFQDTAEDKYLADEFQFENNLWFGFGNGNNPTDFIRADDQAAVINKIVAEGNEIVDPMLAGISRAQDMMLDPRPDAGSPALSGAADVDDEWFIQTSYRGAFSNASNWAEGWTALSANNHFGDLVTRNQILITDADLVGDTEYTWTADNEYLIDGFVFLESGSCLNIEPGTVIRATPNPALDNASALIISRGAQIKAEGTLENPIIFTSQADDLSSADDLSLEGGEGVTDRGSWGGLIILGNGIIGAEGGTGEAAIEGIPAGDDRALYGGTTADDNSGILRYVSIRYGGAALSSGNEINGLTLGGVGSGTSIEFVEVYGNADDGIEIFGGAVDLRYIIGAFCGDESFDTDQAWAGRAQFVFGIQLPNDGLGNQQFGGEHDGSEAEDLSPQVVHKVYNATFIGAGADNSFSNGETNTGLRIRNDVGIEYNNSIITEFATRGVRFQDTAEDKYLADEFQFENNLWFGFGNGNNPTDFIRADDQAAVINKIVAEGNEIVDPMLAGISRAQDMMLDPRPDAGSPALSGAADVDDEWFIQTDYRGAFSAGTNWAEGWTALSANNHFGDLVEREQVLITDADLVGDTEYTWTPENEYLIDGFVFLESGSCLTIEAGTIIKATPNPTLDNASALIITRGAQIKANGTADAPIIFTAQADDLSDPNDMTVEGGEGVTDRGSWGGLIILGNGVIGAEGGTGEAAIEGIPAGEARALYGGSDNADDSGNLSYVSIRYGGAALSSGNEINGLTLGGVGSGTEIEYVEVFGNADDGIEIFGGAVDLKYVIGAFCGDESFDTDQAWAGRTQFLFGLQLQADGLGNQQFGGEHDGSEAEDLAPQVVHKIYNATMIGAGPTNADGNGETNTGLRIRNDVGIEYNNSIITEYANKGVRFQDTAEDKYLADEFQFENNIWWTFGDGNAPTDFIRAEDQAAVINKLVAEGNQVDVDPLLAGISRIADGGLDPRPNFGPALGGAADVDDAWFTQTEYRGAFSNTENWALGWTALDAQGYFGNLVSSTVELGQNERGVLLNAPAPNPVVGRTANFELNLPGASTVHYEVYNLEGKVMGAMKMGNLLEGKNQFNLNVDNYTNGIYVIKVVTDFGAVSQKFSISRRNK